MSGPEGDAYAHRQTAESFGSDPQLYDRVRPRYPTVVIERILSDVPGSFVLDVGVGTGIVARQFQAAGCRVVGVDPDARMAEFARGSGVDVEVARFEDWEAAGRTFDAVVSGESWHWVDPVAGAAKAAAVLRPGGRLAVFWNSGRPQAGVDDAFVDVYRRILPESLSARLSPQAIEQGYAVICAKTVDGIRQSRSFGEPAQWRFEWEHGYTRDAWLEALMTSGGVISPQTMADLQTAIGAAVDTFGGSFTMNYATIVVTAKRTDRGGA